MTADTSLILVALLSALATLFFMYIDRRLFDKTYSKFTYIKNMIMVSAISTLCVYFFQSSAGTGPGQNAANVQLGGTRLVEGGGGDKILTGLPPF
jgi:hypothetical protein